MRSIRAKAFETNSSSTHSITIKEGDQNKIFTDSLPRSITLHKDYFYDGEWHSAQNKLNFIYTYICEATSQHSTLVDLLVAAIQSLYSSVQLEVDIHILSDIDKDGTTNALNDELLSEIVGILQDPVKFRNFITDSESFVDAMPMGGTPSAEQPKDE